MESEDEMEVVQENDKAIPKNYVIQIEDSSTAIMKLRTIFSKIKRSEKMKNKFHSICETMGVPTTLSLYWTAQPDGIQLMICLG